MKWYNLYLIIGAFVFSGFLIYSIASQDETLLFLGCICYVSFITVFFYATANIDNRKDKIND